MKKQTCFHIEEAIASYSNHLQRLSNSSNETTGIPTGFIDLDRVTAGLQPSSLTVVASPFGNQNTSFVSNIAVNSAKNLNNNRAILFFSLEVQKEQLSKRFLCTEAKIDPHKMRRADLDDEEWSRLEKAREILSDKPLFINESTFIHTNEIKSICSGFERSYGKELALVVIDGRPLVSSDADCSQEERYSKISGSLKQLAEEMDIAVVLSLDMQDFPEREDMRPSIRDLRGYGNLVEDTDLVLFLYQDEAYNHESPDKGNAEILIEKSRYGSTGVARVVFQWEYMRFVDFVQLGREEKE